MNDHNLDDLIIETPSQKGGKAKGFLTIIALFIVVLIVAIILTKIILKDPSESQALLEENDTEIISPELTLQDATSDEKEDDTELSDMIKSEMSAPEETMPKEEEKPQTVKEKTVMIDEEKEAAQPKTAAPAAQAQPIKTKKPEADQTKEIVKIPEVATPAPKPVAKPKPVTKPKSVVKPKPVTKSKPKPTPAASKGNFYIQVGSFSKTPSSNSRLLSAIRKHGFHYKIYTINGMKKVMIGPYSSRPAADKAIAKIKDLINKSAFVVKK
jgi:cell division protein FtsN